MFRLTNLIGKLLGKQPQPSTPTQDNDWMARWQQEQERRRQARLERQEAARTRDRLSFGEELRGVSTPHRSASLNEERLQRYNLPVLTNEYDLAEWLGLSRERLRWFTHDRPAETVWHYVRHVHAKRSGGTRTILAPKRELKALQRHIMQQLLDAVPPTDAAHGFRREHSIATNAQPHVGKQVVINLDLKDFFPTIIYPRVRGLFVSLGCSYAVAATLALLCTEHSRETYTHDEQQYYVSVTPRALPQGAPTSPAIANLIAARLDRRLLGLVKKHGWSYTRYADDLTFSGDDPVAIGRVLGAAKRIIADEHFVVHPDKIQITRQSGRQCVTGLVVNSTVSTPRQQRKQLRAILHNAKQTGLAAQNRANHEHFPAYIAGMIGHINAANPAQAHKLQQAFQAVSSRTGDKNEGL